MEPQQTSIIELVAYASLALTFARAVLQNAKPIVDATPTEVDNVWRARLLRWADWLDGVLDHVTPGPSDLRVRRRR